jgi:tetratricopeptide (TPR) repeat protein
MYKSSIKLADFYPQSHYNLGNSYADLGDLSSAESEYKKSLQMNPYFYQSYLKLFALYKYENKTNKQKEVIAQVQQIVQKNPSFQPVLQQLEQTQ